MAEASHLESQSTPSTPDNSSNNNPEPALQYWCYHCEKRVSIETLAADLPDIICFECKNGFVESVPPAAAAAAPTQSQPPPDNNSNNNEDPSFSNQFLQILRLIAEAARDEGDPPPPPPQPAVSDPGDFLRIELNGWNNDDEEDDDDGIDADPSSDNEIANNNDDDDDDDDEEVVRQRRRELLRSRIRDFASRATRNRILDWSEILMGLEDHTMEFRVGGGYVGNPEDYVDAAGYEALLQNLADADAGARRGPPPASRSAISNLNTLSVALSQEESMACAICKDSFSVPVTAKMLPCGHGYHEDCIVTWLGSRNTCPVCRFELPTDDPEYEQQRLKSSAAANGSTSSSNFTSSSNQ